MKVLRCCLVVALCCAVSLGVAACGGSEEGASGDGGSNEEAALVAAIQSELDGMSGLTIDRFEVSGDWAGVWIAAPTADADACPFLLAREGAGWRVVDYGTGLVVDDWIASGAPQDLAEWF